MDVTYLDNNATTRVDDRVVEAMLPVLTDCYGNPSSTHVAGAAAAAELEKARSRVAQLIGARESEIVFTSGGTEADNTAIRGVLAALPERRHLVVSAIEHHAVLDLTEQLESEGVRVQRVGVDGQGRVALDQLEAAVCEDTALVCVMLANNETGVIQPLPEVVRIARSKGARVFTDAVNAVGKMEVNVDQLGVDLLSLSAHKIYGPKGAGALYVRRGTPLRPWLLGGHQERDRRGGTPNMPGIVGLGAACELLAQEGAAECARLRALRDRLERGLRERFEDVHILGAQADRVPNTCCACFAGVEAEALLLVLSQEGICVSSGAACSSGSLEPSHVLQAMGIDPYVAQGQVRISLGRFNTAGDIDRLLDVLPRVVARVAAVNI